MITQKVLNSFKLAQNKIKMLEEALTLKKALLKDAEKDLLERLKLSEKVEKGKWSLGIDVTERRTVSWKSIVQQKLGEAFVVDIIKKTPPEQYEHITVKEVKG